jgi:hypothetical protein
MLFFSIFGPPPHSGKRPRPGAGTGEAVLLAEWPIGNRAIELGFGAKSILGVHRGAEAGVHHAFLDPLGGGDFLHHLVHRPVRGASFRGPFPAGNRRHRAWDRSRRTRRAAASRQGDLDNFDLGRCFRRARRIRCLRRLTHSSSAFKFRGIRKRPISLFYRIFLMRTGFHFA